MRAGTHGYNGADHAVLHSQINRRSLGPIETSNSDANRDVFHSHINRRSLGHIETCKSDPKAAVLHKKTTDEGCNP